MFKGQLDTISFGKIQLPWNTLLVVSNLNRDVWGKQNIYQLNGSQKPFYMAV